MKVSFFNKNILENRIITTEVKNFAIDKNLNFKNNLKKDEFISNSKNDINIDRKGKNMSKIEDFLKKYEADEEKDFFYYLIFAYNHLHNNEEEETHLRLVLSDGNQNKRKRNDLPKYIETIFYKNDKIMQQLHDNPDLCYEILSTKDKKTGEPLLLSFSDYSDKDSFYFKIANALFTTFEDNPEFIKKIIYNIKDSKNENLINKISTVSLPLLLRKLHLDKESFEYILLQKAPKSNEYHGKILADHNDKNFGHDNLSEILLFQIYNTFKNEPDRLNRILHLDKYAKLKILLNSK